MTKDYYKILGIDANADEKSIKSAYRELAHKWHPDKNPENTEEAEEKFKEISEAYSVLSDPEKRKIYDSTGSPLGSDFGGFNNFRATGDPFEMFFGRNFRKPQGPPPPMRGQSIQMNLGISLKEALFGGSREITYDVHSGCQSCNGRGGIEFDICSLCKGSGFIVQERPGMMMQTSCNNCNGQGQSIKTLCDICSGKGIIGENKKLTVIIPAGIKHSNTLRLQGQGGAGFNGGPNGDLLIAVSTEYPDTNSYNDEERSMLERLLSK